MGKKSKRSLIHFNGGEWSPKVDARVDHQKYPAACRQLKNMIPTPHGIVTRRKGLEFVAETKDSGVANLIRFQFSREVSFTLELGESYIRFYRNGVQIESGGLPYEVVSPYGVDEVFDVKFAQINDVVFITHENHPPQVLSRLADDNWTMAAVEFDYPALIDENVEPLYKLELSDVTGSGVTMTATGHAPFTEDHVGSYWRIGHYNDNEINRSLKAFAAGATSGRVFVQGTFTVETTGVWTAKQLEVEQSSDFAFTSPTTIRTLTGEDDKNYNIQMTSPAGGAWYRFKNGDTASTTSDGAGDDRARLKPDDAIRNGIVKVTAYNSSTSVTVDVVRDALNTDATDIWAEGSWSAERGYPKAINFFENRILYAGTAYQPQTVWGSVTDDYYNFERGDEDTDSYAFTLASPERNEIIWIGATTRLIIGTTGGEWMASGNDVDTSITPNSIIVRQHSANGVDQIRPLLLEGRLVYMQRGGRKLRGMEYDGIEERFKGEDLTVLSDHLTAGRVVSMAYQAQRDSLVWAVTGNGKLIGMTYEPDQGVVGWHNHDTSGSFEAVETLYGTGDDEVWCVVNRNINGVNKRFIERFSGYYNPSVDTEATRRMQIGICVDATGSMADEIEDVKEQIAILVVDMEARYDSVTFALITFRDEDDTEVVLDFTDAATVIAALDDITASGGGDTDENGYGAIVLAAESLNWNSGVYDDNVMLVATDAGSHERGNTQAEAIAAMESIEARLVYGSVVSSDYGDIVTAVGGYWIADLSDLADDFSNNVPLYGYSERALGEFFVDSGVTQLGTATVVDGLDHLNGETVQILADGARVPDAVVTAGSITLPYPAAVVHVGLQYESVIQPMRLDVDSQFGVLQGIEKRIYEVVLRLMDTGSVRLKTSESVEWDYVREVIENQGYGEAVALFTGETGANILTTGHNTDPTFILSCNDPLPFTLIAAILKYTVTGDQ